MARPAWGRALRGAQHSAEVRRTRTGWRDDAPTPPATPTRHNKQRALHAPDSAPPQATCRPAPAPAAGCASRCACVHRAQLAAPRSLGRRAQGAGRSGAACSPPGASTQSPLSEAGRAARIRRAGGAPGRASWSSREGNNSGPWWARKRRPEAGAAPTKAPNCCPPSKTTMHGLGQGRPRYPGAAGGFDPWLLRRFFARSSCKFATGSPCAFVVFSAASARRGADCVLCDCIPSWANQRISKIGVKPTF